MKSKLDREVIDRFQINVKVDSPYFLTDQCTNIELDTHTFEKNILAEVEPDMELVNSKIFTSCSAGANSAFFTLVSVFAPVS